MLKSGTIYDDSSFDQRPKSCEQKRISRYIFELEKLGFHIQAPAE